MSANPVYHTYGSGVDAENMNRRVWARPRNFTNAASTKAERPRIRIPTLTVDDWGIAATARFTSSTGARLRTLGMDVDDVDAHYLVSVHKPSSCPTRNGLMAGEDVYSDVAGVKIEKLDPADVVTTEQAFA